MSSAFGLIAARVRAHDRVRRVPLPLRVRGAGAPRLPVRPARHAAAHRPGVDPAAHLRRCGGVRPHRAVARTDRMAADVRHRGIGGLDGGAAQLDIASLRRALPPGKRAAADGRGGRATADRRRAPRWRRPGAHGIDADPGRGRAPRTIRRWCASTSASPRGAGGHGPRRDPRSRRIGSGPSASRSAGSSRPSGTWRHSPASRSSSMPSRDVEDPTVLGPTATVEVYRIIQEALANAARHSGAPRPKSRSRGRTGT